MSGRNPQDRDDAQAKARSRSLAVLGVAFPVGAVLLFALLQPAVGTLLAIAISMAVAYVAAHAAMRIRSAWLDRR